MVGNYWHAFIFDKDRVFHLFSKFTSLAVLDFEEKYKNKIWETANQKKFLHLLILTRKAIVPYRIMLSNKVIIQML